MAMPSKSPADVIQVGSFLMRVSRSSWVDIGVIRNQNDADFRMVQ
jgi:hypothetical protein